MNRIGVVVVKTTGLPTDKRGAPSSVPHYPVAVAIAWPAAGGPKVWSSVVGITRAVAERKDLPEALRFGGLTLDNLRGAPQPATVASAMHAIIAEAGITHLTAWQSRFVTEFLGEAPWSLGIAFPRILDVQAALARAAPANTFTSSQPSISEASAFVAGAIGRGILPPDRTAATMAIQVAHIAAEVQRLRAIAAAESRKESA